MLRAALIAGVIVGTVGLSAQAPNLELTPEQFEVASVKPCPPRNLPAGMVAIGVDERVAQGIVRVLSRGARLEMGCGTVLALLRYAYPTMSGDVRGGPEWIESERFDVRATTSGPTPQSALQAMVRTLLVERFRLRAHYELVERPIYRLVVAAGDGQPKPALQRTALDCTEIRSARARGELPPLTPGTPTCASTSGGGYIKAMGIPLSRLAALISADAGRLVIDETNLEGDFDFELSWNPRPLSIDLPGRPPLFAALSNNLGLELEPARAPVEIVVVDHIDRPTPD